ncbi:MAG: hypothetical protein V3S89_14250 [Desulfobacterales bacterium]
MNKKMTRSITTENHKGKACVSCGAELSGRKRRYCSKECKELLVFALGWLKNLLLPLNTNYATFAFTDSVLIINILSFFSKDVSTFVFRRAPGKTPAQGLKEVCKILNKQWYEKNQSLKSQRAASEHLLGTGVKNFISKDNITPVSTHSNSRISGKLTHFNLKLGDLERNPLAQLKSAYRKEVKKHHPDYGGEPTDFINISEAYKDIIDFIRNPKLRTRTGLPGIWSYDGSSYKWSAPL